MFKVARLHPKQICQLSAGSSLQHVTSANYTENSCKAPSGRKVPYVLDYCCSFLMCASVTFPSLAAQTLQIKFINIF